MNPEDKQKLIDILNELYHNIIGPFEAASYYRKEEAIQILSKY